MSEHSLSVMSDLVNLDGDEIRSLSTEIMSEFSEKYKKLGSFKKVREKHDARGFISRLWNRKDLKNAELDSIELQEDMAQMMGKLTVLQMYAQNAIVGQQSNLEKQQHVLENQTNEIVETNEKIAHQQGELSRQQMELKELVEGYFELKGLTAEQGAKLIKYAKEIEAAKTKIEQDLDEQQQEFSNQVKHLQIAQADGQRLISEHMERVMTDFEALLSRNESQVKDQLLYQEGQIKKTLQDQQQDFQRQCMQQSEQMRIAQDDIATLLEYQKIEGRRVIEAHEKQLEEHSQRTEKNIASYSEKFNQTHLALKRMVSRCSWLSAVGGVVAITALVLALNLRI